MNVRKSSVVSCAVVALVIATGVRGERGVRGEIESGVAGATARTGVIVHEADSMLPMSSRAAECADGEVYDDGTFEQFYSSGEVSDTSEAFAMLFTPPEYPWTYDQVCMCLTSTSDDFGFLFEVFIWEDNGPGGGPGDVLVTFDWGAVVGDAPTAIFHDVDMLVDPVQIMEGSVYIGLAWDPSVELGFKVCADESPTTPLRAGYYTNSSVGDWLTMGPGSSFPDYRALLIRAEGQPDCNLNAAPDETELYVMEDSRNSDLEFSFEDISGTGTVVPLGANEVSGPIAIGFPFEYFGVPQESIYISSNGFLRVNADGDSGCCEGEPIPTPGGDEGDGIIAGWWTELDPSAAGSILYQTIGLAPNRRFIVQYHEVQSLSVIPAATFQFKLYEATHDIEIHMVQTDLSVATIGIETTTGEFGYQYYHGINSFAEWAVRFAYQGGVDCNGNGVLDECEDDCNGNGFADECDLADGTSEDCNGNGIPDECDIADGLSGDCQPDGVPDECELNEFTCLTQLSLETTAVYSDVDCDPCGGSAQVLAEQFQLVETIVFTGVRFRGGYWPSGNAPPDDAFLVTVLRDSGGLPQTVAAILTGLTPADSRVLTGAQVDGVDEYEYVIDFPGSVAAPGSGTLWIQISNNTSGNADTWMWSRGAVDPVLGIPGIAYSYTGYPDEVWFGEPGTDLALELICDNAPDCNGNGTPDDCDINNGLSGDCNEDGVPDECELAGGTAEDCNGNGILDACEVEPEFEPSELTLPELFCASAQHVCPGYTYAGTTGALGPGTSQSLFCGVFFGVNDVWYRYRPRWTGQAYVTVQGPPIDWLISVYSGCPGTTANQIACNDLSSGAFFDAEAGEEYLIRLAGSGFTFGPYELSLLGPDCLPSTADTDGNGVPDECDCPADVNGDGVVDNGDYIAVLMAQGPCAGCPEDIDGSGVVDSLDLQIVLTSQGPCPF